MSWDKFQRDQKLPGPGKFDAARLPKERLDMLKPDPYGTENALRAAGVIEDDVRKYHGIALEADNADRQEWWLPEFLANIKMLVKKRAAEAADPTFSDRIVQGLERASRFRTIRERFSELHDAQEWAKDTYEQDHADFERLPLEQKLANPAEPMVSDYLQTIEDWWDGKQQNADVFRALEHKLLDDPAVKKQYNPWTGAALNS